MNGAPILPATPVLVIESDASNMGWGATNGHEQTGGLWSVEEAVHHINYLELMAVFLALKTFTRDQSQCTVLCKSDNVTAVSYLNHKGGLHSDLLCKLAVETWEWCLNRGITLIAEHLPGLDNTTADWESRTNHDRSDWKLNSSVFQVLQQQMGPLEVDLFASRLTALLPRFYSWHPDPEAEATDAFTQNWALHRGYANPPWCLINRCLGQITQQEARVVLITPRWTTQPWFPVALGMLEDYPTLTSQHSRFSDLASGETVHNGSGNPTIDRMAHLRSTFSSQGLSTKASELLLSSWRSKTNKSYNSLCSKWISWCQSRDRNPFEGPVSDVVNFLAELHSQGYQYRSLNSYRSAISSIHSKIEGHPVGEHPLVSKVLKEAYNARPPLPRYNTFWDVGVVLQYIKGLGQNSSLTLCQISIKTAMLLALTRPSRSADLANLDISARTYVASGVIFKPLHLSKQSSFTSNGGFLFPQFTQDPGLCPVQAPKAYESRTAAFRNLDENTTQSKLFLSWIGKHAPVTSSTIVRWLRTCLLEAGIDTSMFKAHSVRGASCSTAVWSGVTIGDILKAADWSSEGTFQTFYHRNKDSRESFGISVLTSAASSNLHVDMETEPSEM